MKDSVDASANLSVAIQRHSGEQNTINATDQSVSCGAGYIAARVLGLQDPVSHMAIGIGRKPKTQSDTGLEKEVVRVGLTSASIDGDRIVFTAQFPSPDEPVFFTEAGLFNAPVRGAMMSRAVFDQQEQFPGDTIDIVWTVKIKQG